MARKHEFPTVPIVDVAPLFGGRERSRRKAADAAGASLLNNGAFIATGFPDGDIVDRRAATMLSFFDLPQNVKLALATRRVRPDSARTYRGYVATLESDWAYNETYDIGPEHVAAAPMGAGTDVFAETNAWPNREPAAGWRDEMIAFHGQMDRLGAALLPALARYLDIPGPDLMARFIDANSTLRILHYPPRPAAVAIREELPEKAADAGAPRLVTGRHTDASGLSVLWQRDPGLQAQAPDGTWQDVPIVANGVAVHIGTALEFMTAGRLQATPHRVVDQGGARRSIGFFAEPGIAASLSPLIDAETTIDPPESYGAHLLDRFAGYDGYEHLKQEFVRQ